MNSILNEASDPWFTVVEIEVNARCNRRCGYCPVSVLPTPSGDRFMNPDVFEHIVAELVRIAFRGNISYHLFNEPLLRRDLELLVSKVTAHLPGAFQLLFTNGDLLSDERYMSLRQAGIDHFLVTKHDFVPIPQRAQQTVQFPSDLVLVNRGGLLGEVAEPLIRPCFAPSDMLIITINGDVLLCCDDAKREHVMGNITRQSLDEIWLSPHFVHIRKLLRTGNRRDASKICRQCNNLEYFAPGENDHKHLGKGSL
jgi:GTP 3',8-cyclase